MISVHDNVTKGYRVDASTKCVTIYTEYPSSDPKEQTDIIFDGVLCYFFQHDLFHNIILDIEEWPLESFLQENETRFDESWKWGWPLGWDKRKEDFRSFLIRHDVKIFSLDSSYGMDGWVIAQSMNTQRAQPSDAANASRR